MNEQDLHNDPWHKKLQQVPVPDVEDSWKEMHLLLDRELPVAHKDDRLKWVLLVLVLLLCVGVCNCPGTWRRQASLQKDHATPGVPVTSGDQKNTAAGYQDSIAKKRAHAESTVAARRPETAPELPAGHISKTGKGPYATTDTGNSFSVKGNPSPVPAPVLHPSSHNTKYTGKNRLPAGRKNFPPVSVQNENNKAVTKGRKPLKSPRAQLQQSIENPQLIIMPRQDTGKALQHTITDSILRRTRIDTARYAMVKVPPEPAGTLRKPGNTTMGKDAERGWAFAAGINHFIRIGRQQPAAFNSDGTSGVLADYIPVPQLRYYLSRKAYVQAEVQLNTPQYTKELLAKEEVSDTSGTRPRVKSSVFIKKLFYSNIPLSVHYSPFRNFFVGTGVQFSTLSNGVALFDEKQLTPNRPDSTIMEKVQSFKGDTMLYGKLKTNEWRFLVDMNYQWKRFTPGIRYNQALTRFINLRVSGTQVTQARNHSLQLYVRYVLWRKPGEILSTAK